MFRKISFKRQKKSRVVPIKKETKNQSNNNITTFIKYKINTQNNK